MVKNGSHSPRHSISKVQKDFFIDSHVHIFPKKRLQGLVKWILGLIPDHPVSATVVKEDILHDLKQEGVTHFFNLVYPLREEEAGPLNEFNARFCESTPGAIPFATLHQDTPDKAGVAEKALKSHPFIGFKFHSFVQGFDPWDPRMDPLYAFLQEAGRPVILHTGYGDYYGKSMPASGLRAWLKRYPRLPVVFAHMAFPEFAEAFSMLEEFPDLYLDAALVLPCRRPAFEPLLDSIPGGIKIMDVLIEGLEKYKGRIMYGSDHPAGMGGLSDIYRDLNNFPISEAAKRSIRKETPMAFISRFQPDFDWGESLAAWDRAKWTVPALRLL